MTLREWTFIIYRKIELAYYFDILFCSDHDDDDDDVHHHHIKIMDYEF